MSETSVSVDAAIARIEEEMPQWGWSVFSRAEDYQAHLWSREDKLNAPQVFVYAPTPSEALILALQNAKNGHFSFGAQGKDGKTFR